MSDLTPFKPLFPTLDYTRSGRIDLEAVARNFFERLGPTAKNPLLDPVTLQREIDLAHLERGLEWSFGGYLENRATLLRTTYLDETGGYLHMGIDCNVPAGTPLAAPFSGAVIDLFDDPGEPQGWGPRVILATEDVRAPFIVFGHLGPHRVAIGDRIGAGEIFGEIAPPPRNGYWFPHLHLQLLSRVSEERCRDSRFEMLDGYGHSRDRAQLIKDFPDPTWLIADHQGAA